MTSSDFVRRNNEDYMTPCETAIRKAMLEIEKMPADTRLTEAVVLLGQAKDKVGDFVDEFHDKQEG
jgi:hypothetical protein